MFDVKNAPKKNTKNNQTKNPLKTGAFANLFCFALEFGRKIERNFIKESNSMHAWNDGKESELAGGEMLGGKFPFAQFH